MHQTRQTLVSLLHVSTRHELPGRAETCRLTNVWRVNILVQDPSVGRPISI